MEVVSEFLRQTCARLAYGSFHVQILFDDDRNLRKFCLVLLQLFCSTGCLLIFLSSVGAPIAQRDFNFDSVPRWKRPILIALCAICESIVASIALILPGVRHFTYWFIPFSNLFLFYHSPLLQWLFVYGISWLFLLLSHLRNLIMQRTGLSDSEPSPSSGFATAHERSE
jgi:hypothetical protein